MQLTLLSGGCRLSDTKTRPFTLAIGGHCGGLAVVQVAAPNPDQRLRCTATWRCSLQGPVRQLSVAWDWCTPTELDRGHQATEQQAEAVRPQSSHDSPVDNILSPQQPSLQGEQQTHGPIGDVVFLYALVDPIPTGSSASNGLQHPVEAGAAQPPPEPAVPATQITASTSGSITDGSTAAHHSGHRPLPAAQAVSGAPVQPPAAQQQGAESAPGQLPASAPPMSPFQQHQEAAAPAVGPSAASSAQPPDVLSAALGRLRTRHSSLGGGSSGSSAAGSSRSSLDKPLGGSSREGNMNRARPGSGRVGQPGRSASGPSLLALPRTPFCSYLVRATLVLPDLVQHPKPSTCSPAFTAHCRLCPAEWEPQHHGQGSRSPSQRSIPVLDRMAHPPGQGLVADWAAPATGSSAMRRMLDRHGQPFASDHQLPATAAPSLPGAALPGLATESREAREAYTDSVACFAVLSGTAAPCQLRDRSPSSAGVSAELPSSSTGAEPQGAVCVRPVWRRAVRNPCFLSPAAGSVAVACTMGTLLILHQADGSLIRWVLQLSVSETDLLRLQASALPEGRAVSAQTCLLPCQPQA